jgi:hypothetical protein
LDYILNLKFYRLIINIIIIVYIFPSVTETVNYNSVNLLNLINVSGSDSLNQLYTGKLRRNSYIRVTAGLYKEEGDLNNNVNAIIINGFDNINLIILIVLSVINISL